MLPRTPIEHAGSRPGFLAATFDGFTALFPQSCIVAVEQRANLTRPDGQLSVYSKDGIDARVFALSRKLQPLSGVERPYFFVARHGGRTFGLACDELNVINAARIRLKSIPKSLKCGNSPIESYAQYGNRIVFECSLAGIAALLPVEDFHASSCDPRCPV